MAICRTSVWPHQYLDALRLERVRDLLSRCRPGPVAVRSEAWWISRQTVRMPNGDERPAEPLVLSPPTRFMDCPCRRGTSSGRRIRARSLAEHRAYAADAGSEHAPRCARAAEKHGSRPAVNRRSSSTPGILCASLQSRLATHKTSVFSTLLGQTGALLTVIPLEAEPGCR